MYGELAADAVCLDCNYSLRGLVEHRCPECGRPFDPGDATTFSPGLPISRFMRYWLAPGGWLLRGWPVAGAIALATLPYDTWLWPGPGIFSLVYDIPLRSWTFPPAKEFIGFLWVALLIVWTIRAAMRSLVVRRYRQPPELSRTDLRLRRWTTRWFLIGVFLAGCKTYECPHGRYLSIWDFGGAALCPRDGDGPCYHQASASVHIAGPLWLFAE
jgi:hypothetical protein